MSRIARSLGPIDGAHLAERLQAYVIATRTMLRARIISGSQNELRIEFYGGSQGTHSLALSASSEARVIAHWRGYCEANGLQLAPGEVKP